MAAAFNLTAQLNLKGPTNIGSITSSIKKQLGTITANVDLKINATSIQKISQLNAGLQQLNKTLSATTVSATSASAAIKGLAQAFGAVNLSTLPQQISATSTALGQMKAQSSQAAKALADSTTQMEEFGKQSALAVRRFAAFSIVTSSIYALSNSINKGIEAFIEYDQQFVKLQQVTGQSADGLKSLSREITSLSVGLGVSSAALTDVASTLAQAGLNAQDTEKALKALALSSLAPSFDSMNETVEGSIALMRQFGISAGGLEGALGSVNTVAAKFAVEASDIITAVQRTGGVFATASKGVSEGTDALNEFIAVFTSIRATTRESAETIATGLRTIFTRIQRGSTIDALKEFGVNLQDTEGKFVGAYKAVELLSKGLSSLDPRDVKFSKIVEELGGFRQIGKVIPLIQQFSVAQNALKIAQQGQGSLAKDAATAQLSLANQIQKVRQEFLALFREMGQSQGFQVMVKATLSLASALIKVVDASKGLLPLLGVMLAFKGASAITQFASGFGQGLKPGAGKKGQEKPLFSQGGPVRAFASGGVVPGSGDGDTVPAMLTPGEFVIRKKAVQAIGSQNLHRMNKYAKGGPVALDRVSQFSSGKQIPSYIGRYSKVLQDEDEIEGEIDRRTIGQQEIEQYYESNPHKQFSDYIKKRTSAYSAGKKSTIKQAGGYAFEDFIGEYISKKDGLSGYRKTKDPKAPLDFVGGEDPVEVRFRQSITPDETILAKRFRHGMRYSTSKILSKFTPEIDDRPPADIGKSIVYQVDPSYKKAMGFAFGGKVQKFLKGGTVEETAQLENLSLQDAILAQIKELGGIGGVKKLIGTSGSDRTLDSLLRANVIKQKDAIDPKALKAVNDALSNEEGKKIRRAQDINKSQKLAVVGLQPFDKSDEIPFNIPGFESSTIFVRGLSSKYADAVSGMRQMVESTIEKFGTDIQSTMVFGGNAPLALDFDETLVSGADIFGPNGKPDIPAYSDLDKVAKALNGDKVKLTPLGEKIKEIAGFDPSFINRIRVLTARPQSNAGLLSEKLNELGIPLGADKITGVSGGNKGAAMGMTERLIDDNIKNINDAKRAGKSAVQYAELRRLSEEEKAATGNANAEGAILEAALAKMGAVGGNVQNRAVDFENGLGMAAAQAFPGIAPDWPTEVKRTLSSDNIGRAKEEFTRYYTENYGPFPQQEDAFSFDKAGMPVSRFAMGGKASRKVDYEAGVGPSPFGGSISKRLSQSVYNLQKGTGLSDQEFNEIKKTADTYGYDEKEFKDYLAKRIQEKKNKSGLKSDPSALLRAITPGPNVASQRQLDLAEQLKGTRGFAAGGVAEAEQKKEKQYGKISITEDGTMINAGYLKNDSRQGYATAYKMRDNLYYVGLSSATSGYGPKLYDVLMEAATEKGAMLTSDRSMVSGDAQKVWEFYFKNRGDVKKTPLKPSDWTRNDALIDPKLYGKEETWPPSTDPAWILQSGYSKSPDLINGPDVIRQNGKLDSRAVAASFFAARKPFASGGSVQDTVPALLTPGEFVVNKQAAQRIGYSKLHQLNHADKVAGYNKGGIVGGVQGYASGGTVSAAGIAGSIIDWLKTQPGAVPPPKLGSRPDNVNRSTVQASDESANSLKDLVKALNELKISAANSAAVLNRGGELSYKAIEKALQKDIERMKVAGISIDTILAAEQTLADIRKKGKGDVKDQQKMETMFGTRGKAGTKILNGMTVGDLAGGSAAGQQAIDAQAKSLAQKRIASYAPGSLSPEDEGKITKKSYLDTAARVTGAKKSDFKAAGISGSDIQQYIAESMRDRKTLSTMDKQLIALRMEEYKNAGTVRGISANSAKEAKALADEEVSQRREIINDLAKVKGEKGVGAAGLTDFRNSPILKKLKEITPSQYLTGAAATAGFISSNGDSIAKGLYNTDTDTGKLKAAKTGAAISSAGTIASTGLGIAAQSLAIPVIGPYVAAITVVGTGLVALGDSLFDFTGSQEKATKEVEKALRAKEINAATTSLDDAFKRFENDMGNIDLQEALSKALSNAVMAQAKDTRANVDQAKQDYAYQNRSYGDLLNLNFKGSAQMDAKQLAEVNREEADKFAPFAEKGYKQIQEQINGGASIEQIMRNDKLSGARQAIAMSTPESISEYTAAVKGEEKATGKPITEKRDKEIIDEIAARRINTKEEILTAIKAKEVADALEMANLAGRKLAQSFQRMYDSIDQAINKNNFNIQQTKASIDYSTGALSGNAVAPEINSKNINVLENPKAYSSKQFDSAINVASQSLPAEDAAMVKGAATLQRNLAPAIEAELRKNLSTDAGLTVDKAAETAKKTGTEQVKALRLPKEMEDTIINQLTSSIDSKAKEKGVQEEFANGPKAATDKFIESIREASDTIIENAGKGGIDTLKKLLTGRQDIFNDFTKNLAKSSSFLKQHADALVKASNIVGDAKMNLREALTGVGESFAEAKTRFDSEISNLTGGTTDPKVIGANIENLQNRGKGLIEQRDNAVATGTDADVQKFVTELNQTNDSIRDNREALDRLANSSELAGKALGEVTKVRDLQKNRSELVNKLLTQTPEEAKKLNDTFVRLQNNLRGGLNTGANSRAAREAFSQALRSGSSLQGAYRAGNTVLAQQRQETLSMFQDPNIRGANKLQMKNQGYNDEQIENILNQQEAMLKRQMAVETGQINNPMVQADIMATQNRKFDPAMAKASDEYTKITGRQADANTEGGRLALVQSLLVDSNKLLKESLDGLTLEIRNARGFDAKVEGGKLGAAAAVAAGTGASFEGVSPAGGRAPGPMYASAGALVNFQPKGTDTVPAMLTPGEFVINRESTQQHLPLLQAINKSKGGVVYLAEGSTNPLKSALGFAKESYNTGKSIVTGEFGIGTAESAAGAAGYAMDLAGMIPSIPSGVMKQIPGAKEVSSVVEGTSGIIGGVQDAMNSENDVKTRVKGAANAGLSAASLTSTVANASTIIPKDYLSKFSSAAKFNPLGTAILNTGINAYGGYSDKEATEKGVPSQLRATLGAIGAGTASSGGSLLAKPLGLNETQDETAAALGSTTAMALQGAAIGTMIAGPAGTAAGAAGGAIVGAGSESAKVGTEAAMMAYDNMYGKTAQNIERLENKLTARRNGDKFMQALGLSRGGLVYLAKGSKEPVALDDLVDMVSTMTSDPRDPIPGLQAPAKEAAQTEAMSSGMSQIDLSKSDTSVVIPEAKVTAKPGEAPASMPGAKGPMDYMKDTAAAEKSSGQYARQDLPKTGAFNKEFIEEATLAMQSQQEKLQQMTQDRMTSSQFGPGRRGFKSRRDMMAYQYGIRNYGVPMTPDEVAYDAQQGQLARLNPEAKRRMTDSLVKSGKLLQPGSELQSQVVKTQQMQQTMAQMSATQEMEKLGGTPSSGSAELANSLINMANAEQQKASSFGRKESMRRESLTRLRDMGSEKFDEQKAKELADLDAMRQSARFASDPGLEKRQQDNRDRSRRMSLMGMSPAERDAKDEEDKAAGKYSGTSRNDVYQGLKDKQFANNPELKARSQSYSDRSRRMSLMGMSPAERDAKDEEDKAAGKYTGKSRNDIYKELRDKKNQPVAQAESASPNPAQVQQKAAEQKAVQEVAKQATTSMGPEQFVDNTQKAVDAAERAVETTAVTNPVVAQAQEKAKTEQEAQTTTQPPTSTSPTSPYLKISDEEFQRNTDLARQNTQRIRDKRVEDLRQAGVSQDMIDRLGDGPISTPTIVEMYRNRETSKFKAEISNAEREIAKLQSEQRKGFLGFGKVDNSLEIQKLTRQALEAQGRLESVGQSEKPLTAQEKAVEKMNREQIAASTAAGNSKDDRSFDAKYLGVSFSAGAQTAGEQLGAVGAGISVAGAMATGQDMSKYKTEMEMLNKAGQNVGRGVEFAREEVPGAAFVMDAAEGSSKIAIGGTRMVGAGIGAGIGATSNALGYTTFGDTLLEASQNEMARGFIGASTGVGEMAKATGDLAGNVTSSVTGGKYGGKNLGTQAFGEAVATGNQMLDKLYEQKIEHARKNGGDTTAMLVKGADAIGAGAADLGVGNVALDAMAGIVSKGSKLAGTLGKRAFVKPGSFPGGAKKLTALGELATGGAQMLDRGITGVKGVIKDLKDTADFSLFTPKGLRKAGSEISTDVGKFWKDIAYTDILGGAMGKGLKETKSVFPMTRKIAGQAGERLGQGFEVAKDVVGKGMEKAGQLGKKITGGIGIDKLPQLPGQIKDKVGSGLGYVKDKIFGKGTKGQNWNDWLTTTKKSSGTTKPKITNLKPTKITPSVPDPFALTGVTSPAVAEKITKNVTTAQDKAADLFVRYASSPENAARAALDKSKLVTIPKVSVDPSLAGKTNTLTKKVGGVGGQYSPKVLDPLGGGKVSFPNVKLAQNPDIALHEVLHGVQDNLGFWSDGNIAKNHLDYLKPQMEEFLKPGGAYEKLVKDSPGVGFYTGQQIKDAPYELLTSIGQVEGTKAFKKNKEAQQMLREVVKAMGYNNGGIVYAANGALMSAMSKGSDTVPAMLTPGEFVMNRQSTQEHLPLLKAINSGNYEQGGLIKYMAQGGVVTPQYKQAGGSITGMAASAGAALDTGALAELAKELPKLKEAFGSFEKLSDFTQSFEKLTQNMGSNLTGFAETVANMPNKMEHSMQAIVNGTINSNIPGANTQIVNSRHEAQVVYDQNTQRLDRASEGAFSRSDPTIMKGTSGGGTSSYA